MKIHRQLAGWSAYVQGTEGDDHSPLFALDTIHVADAVCQKTAYARTQDTKREKHGVAQRRLLAGVVFCNEQGSTYFG
jgi:hypothetical protein